MECWKNFSDLLQNIFTILGITIGGIWTYLIFVRQRLGLPKLNIDLCSEDVILPENIRLIHVQLKLSNIGSVIVTPEYAELRLRKIIPIPEEVRSDIKNGNDPVSEEKQEIAWPMYVGREWKWNSGEIEIEPGENDSLHADFFIPIEIQTIQFYCFIANSKKKKKKIGWTHIKIHTFN